LEHLLIWLREVFSWLGRLPTAECTNHLIRLVGDNCFCITVRKASIRMNQPQRQFDVAQPTRLAACPKQWTKINLVDAKLVYQHTSYSLSTVPLQSEGSSRFTLRCSILPVIGGINLQLFNRIVQHYSNDGWFEVGALDIIYVPFVTWIQELVGHC